MGTRAVWKLSSSAIASRRALLGLDAPTKIAPTSPDGDEAYHTHVMAEIMRRAENVNGGPEIIDDRSIDREAKQYLLSSDPSNGDKPLTEGDSEDDTDSAT